VLVVALVGVAVNIVAAWVLAKANRSSLNIEGATTFGSLPAHTRISPRGDGAGSFQVRSVQRERAGDYLTGRLVRADRDAGGRDLVVDELEPGWDGAV
jgi:hypothetical protein